MMADNHELMSDEHLDEIDELLHNNEQVPSDLVRLLANEVERLRAALEQEQREHGNCEDYHFRMSQTQLQAMVALAEQNTAMRPIVEAVAEAGVGDEYGDGSWLMFAGYDAETIRTKARALIAHPTKE